MNSAVNSPTDDSMAKLFRSSVFLAVLLLLYERTAAQSSEADGSAVTALYPSEYNCSCRCDSIPGYVPGIAGEIKFIFCRSLNVIFTLPVAPHTPYG